MTEPATAAKVEHELTDLSPDDSGKWWWLCSCDNAQGGYPYEHAAHRGWGEHRDANA